MAVRISSISILRKAVNKITDRQVAEWEKKIDNLYIQAAQELNEEKRRQIYIETQKSYAGAVYHVFI